jgi:hypothetical protein
MKDILFVRPADDSAATQIAAWGQAVRQYAARFKADDLCSSQATRVNVDSRLSVGFRHLFWFGHGTEQALIAHGAGLVDSANIGKVRGGMVVAIACYSAIKLGRMAKAGSYPRAYLGFDDEFGFPANAPLRMMFAVTRGLSGLFLRADDIQSAAMALRKQFDSARVDYKKNGTAWGLSPADARTAWLFAKSNRYSLKTHGDLTTVL